MWSMILVFSFIIFLTLICVYVCVCVCVCVYVCVGVCVCVEQGGGRGGNFILQKLKTKLKNL